MESTHKFNLDHAINLFIQDVSQHDLLSLTEKDEIKDHLLLEIEDLKPSGLNPREAFEVSKLRFGTAEQIREEYQKIKPFQSFYHYTFFSIILLFFFK